MQIHGSLLPPAWVLASWPTANYTTFETLGLGPPVTIIVLCVLATVVMAARVYARAAKLGASFGVDDWAILAALVRLKDQPHHSQTELILVISP